MVQYGRYYDMSIIRTNKLQSINGQTYQGVLQVVNYYFNSQTVTTSASWADTGLTANITPYFSTSKILVRVEEAQGSNSGYANLRLLRNGTVLITHAISVGYSGTLYPGTMGHEYLDSPSTTSTLTYKTQFYAANGTIRYNYDATYSSITLMEIAQ